MGFSTLLAERNRLQGIAGVPTASNTARYDEHVNDAIEKIVAEHDWAFLRNPFSDAFNTEAGYSTGTISTTAGSTTITGTGALWTTAGLATSAGRYEILIGSEVYGVTLGSDNNGTLTRGAVSTLTNVTFRVFRRIYALTARMRSIEAAWVLVTPRWPIEIVDWTMLSVEMSGTPVFGAYPERMAFANIDTADVSQVIVDPPPSQVQSIYFSGFQEVAALTDTGTAIPLPKRFKPAFHELADYFMFKFRDDARSKISMEAYMDMIDRLIKADDPSQGTLDKGNLDPHFFRSRSRRQAPSRSGNP